MKLRQKLAMVMAAAMVVTAVPVTTMAASTNAYNRNITVMKDDVLDTHTKLALNIKLDAAVAANTTEVFYVEATDFEFTRADYVGYTKGNLSVVPSGEATDETTKELKVTVAAGGQDEALDIFGKVTGTAPTIIVDGVGSLVSSGKYPILGTDGVVSDKALTVKAGDPTSISIDGAGTIAAITIDEVVAGKLEGTEVKIALDRKSDLVFKGYTKGSNLPASEYSVNRGLNPNGTIEVVDVDAEELTLKFTGFGNGKGAVTLKGLAVAAEGRDDVPTGTVKATITSKKSEKAVLEVAKVNDFGVKLTVKDDKAVEFIAGGEAKEVKVTLAELAADSFSERHNVYITVENATVINAADFNTDNATGNTDGLTWDADKKEFTLDLTKVIDPADTNRTKLHKTEITLKLAAKPGSTKDIVVNAESRGFKEDLEVTVGTVSEDRTFKVEKATLEVGTRGQKGGSIVVSEEEAGVFQKGQYMIIELEKDAAADDITLRDFEVEADKESGLEVAKADLYVKADGSYTFDKDNGSTDIDFVKYTKASNAVAVKVTRESDEVATITVKDFVFNTTNSTPDGTYKVALKGSLVANADDQEEEKIEKDFIVVGSGAANIGSVVVTLNVGQQEYEVDGVKKAAETAPFIDEKGRTMAPVRSVAEAFGCDLDFYFPEGSDQLVITLKKGGKFVQFQNKSNIMTVNGGQYIMDTTAQIKDGYTYVPVRFLAEALGITVEWLPATQTIIFK